MLFLGETLLIPHLYPIVEALAARGAAVDCWVATSVHEALIAGWLREAGLAARIRRAPGYRAYPALVRGENPPLPHKLKTLARLVPHLLLVDAVLCAEQTSLWVPALLPPLRPRFVKTSHGVGSMSARDDRRRRAAGLMLVPSAREKETYLARGFADAAITVTGYVKSAFRGLARPRRLFADDRPVILYTPHWQRARSSWWEWGQAVVAMLAAQDRWNVILAPHQRLVETAPEVRAVLGAVAELPHVHVDLDGFAGVDGSYTAAADLYLGDTSSQIVEYLIRPRPCVFLNPRGEAWQGREDHAFWRCGEVVDRLDALAAAIERASARHPHFADEQRAYAAGQLGETGPQTAVRAAEAILARISPPSSS